MVTETIIPKGYRKTDIGVIPDDWEVKSIEQLCVPNGLVRGPFGGSLKKEFFVESGIKVYEQKNAIYRDKDRGTYYIDNSKFIELKRFEVKEGDFIVSCSGTIGRIFKIPKNSEKGIINQALLKIEIDESIVDDQYFYYYFDWEKFQERIIDNTQGGAMKNLVGMSIFRNTAIPLPPTKAEQTAISTALKDTNALISSIEELISKKINIKQGAMQELLTGKKRLPGFSGEWETKLFGNLIEINKGQQINKSELTATGDYPDWNGGIEPSGYTTKWNMAENTITISEGGNSCGFVNYCKQKFWCGGHCYALKIMNANLDKLFLYQLLKLKEKLIMSLRIGSGLPNIQKKNLNEFDLFIPKDSKEQSAIAQILSDMGLEIEQLEQKLDKYKMIKQGMMQELLTGRTRLI